MAVCDQAVGLTLRRRDTIFNRKSTESFDIHNTAEQTGKTTHHVTTQITKRTKRKQTQFTLTLHEQKKNPES